jgi:hypothetical protein
MDRNAFLMPDYDEYAMSYREREALAPSRVPPIAPSVYSHWFVQEGRIEGTWRFSPNKPETAVVTPYFDFEGGERERADLALERYKAFWKRG